MRCYYCNGKSSDYVCPACKAERAFNESHSGAKSVWSRKCTKQVAVREEGGLNTMELAFQRLGFMVRPQ